MQRGLLIGPVLLAILLCWTMLFATPVQAQEPDGVSGSGLAGGASLFGGYDVSINALSPVNCAVMPSPVVGIETSKGQNTNDITNFTGNLTANGYSVGTVNINAGPVPACVDVLVVQGLSNDQALPGIYTSTEGSILKTWVANGHGLMLSGDWGTFTSRTQALFLAFGYSQQGTTAASDPDAADNDPAGPGNVWNIYQQAENFTGHPALSGVNAVELLASSWLNPAAGAIITTDANASPASRPVAAAFSEGAGCVFMTADSNWNAVMGIANGYFKQDNARLARQAIGWLNSCASAAPGSYTVFLPLLSKGVINFPIFVGNAIASRPVAGQGEIFYRTTIQIPNFLPEGGHYYFSATPDRVSPVVVDDQLVMLFNRSNYFSYIFSPGGIPPQPAIVEVPQSTIQQLAGQTVTIEYRDLYSVAVSASTIWLIWTP